MYLRKICLPGTVLILMLACGGQRQPQDTAPKNVAPQAAARALPDTLVYTMQTVEQKTGDCESDEGCATVLLQYPEIVGVMQGGLNDSLGMILKRQVFAPLYRDGQATARAVAERTPQNLAESFLQEFREFQKESPGYVSAWSLERTMSVIRNQPPLLTLKIVTYSYTGGAHPNHFTEYINLDTRTGKQVHLRDLVKTGMREKLLAAAEKRFRSQHNLSEKQTWDQLGFFFEDNKFQLNDNFIIDKEGLTFLYNPYEIAPYAFGSTEFKLSYETLEPFLVDSDLLQTARQ